MRMHFHSLSDNVLKTVQSQQQETSTFNIQKIKADMNKFKKSPDLKVLIEMSPALAKALIEIGRKSKSIKMECAIEVLKLHDFICESDSIVENSFWLHYMKACCILKDSHRACKTHKHLLETGCVPDEHLYDEYFQALVGSVHNSNVVIDEYKRAKYKNLQFYSPFIFWKVIEALTSLEGRAKFASQILHDMAGLGIKPKLQEVIKILDAGIDDKDCNVIYEAITVMGNLGCFPDQGQSLRILGVAVNGKNIKLVWKVWSMMLDGKVKYLEPHCSAAAQAMLNENKDEHAIVFLSVMEQQGIFSPSRTLKTFGGIIGSSIPRLDYAYYCINQAHSAGEKVSISSLNLILYGCSSDSKGMCIDRAFATFDDFLYKFVISPNLDTYNALIETCANVYLPQPKAAYVLVNKMIKCGITPNTDTFEGLIKSNLFKKEFKNTKDILELVQSKNLTLPPRTMWLLLEQLTIHHKQNLFRDTVKKLNRNLNAYPTFIEKRIEDL